MSEPEYTQVELADEDGRRFAELKKEVEDRLDEIADIASRALDMELDGDAVKKFVPKPAKSGTDEADSIYIEILEPDGGPPICVIDCPDGSHYIERPCGSGPLPC